MKSTCLSADLHQKMAQGSLGPKSYCRFWWNAVLALCSMLGAKLTYPSTPLALQHLLLCLTQQD